MNAMRPAASGAIICTAFEGQRRIASGDLNFVVRKTKPVADAGGNLPILIFEDATSALIEVDFRGTIEQVMENLLKNSKPDFIVCNVPQKRSLGRPRLGVIAREVTLLPGHWDWLDAQSGGASAALRRLVHEAKCNSKDKDYARQSQEAVYKFMTAMAGNLPGYEEALRAFYRNDQPRFTGLIKTWPKDIRFHVKKLVAASLHP